MDFFLFVLLNAVLFVRPSDIFPDLDGAPIYEGVILLCMAASAPKLLRRLSPRRMYEQPVVAAVVGLVVAVALSHLAWGRSAEAFQWGVQVLKIVIYFLLLVAVVDTPARLRQFVQWVGVLVLGMTGLALAQYHGAIDLPALASIQQSEVDPETGEAFKLARLCGAGIFNDPNDLSVILVVGLVLGLYQLRQPGPGKLFWAGSLGLMGYALTLTHSRGGFLALAVAVLALVASRLGSRRALLVGVPVVVGLAVLIGGRQTNIDLGNTEDTAQQRIRLWKEGLVQLEQHPVVGIGAGQCEEELGQVAHNSFVHAFVELGILGGVLYLGAFAVPLLVLYRLGSDRDRRALSPILRDLRPFVLACLAGTMAGMLSLSRVYTLTPYLILGLATVLLGLVGPVAARRLPRLSLRLVTGVLALSAMFLAAVYVFTRLVTTVN
ncbi:MAG TPA: O-antigen ligase family protein [Gemmataceae bacterium]|nr:O-antigen ligase family protein [Gemmataceae bacterium]